MPLPRQTQDEITTYVRAEVAAGFTPPDEILTNAWEIVLDQGCNEAETRLFAQREMDERVAELTTTAKSWPRVTDFDRLSAAFYFLNDTGIVARHN